MIQLASAPSVEPCAFNLAHLALCTFLPSVLALSLECMWYRYALHNAQVSLNLACVHALRMRTVQVSLEELAEVREGLAATCGADEPTPPPPQPQQPPPLPQFSPPAASTGRQLLLQRALNPATSTFPGLTAAMSGFPPAGPRGGVPRKWRSTLSSGATIAASAEAAETAVTMPPSRVCSGPAGTSYGGPVRGYRQSDDALPSGLLLALMSGSGALNMCGSGVGPMSGLSGALYKCGGGDITSGVSETLCGVSGRLQAAMASVAGDGEASRATAAAAAAIGILSRIGSGTEDAEVQRSLLEMLVGRQSPSLVSVMGD